MSLARVEPAISNGAVDGAVGVWTSYNDVKLESVLLEFGIVSQNIPETSNNIDLVVAAVGAAGLLLEEGLTSNDGPNNCFIENPSSIIS